MSRRIVGLLGHSASSESLALFRGHLPRKQVTMVVVRSVRVLRGARGEVDGADHHAARNEFGNTPPAAAAGI
jgi:hypothetical protein